jgi:O-antigen ligase
MIAGALAWGAGAAAAVLHLAGALKTAPPLAGLPFDLSLAAVGLLAPLALLVALGRRWSVEPALALPLVAAALLWLWLVIAASWTSSRLVAEAKLADLVLAGPAMLAAGLLIGAEPTARRAMAAVSLGIGIAVAASVAWGAAIGWPAASLPDPQALRLQYQLAGLAMAGAAALAALAAVTARARPSRGFWLLVVAALAVAALLPGGRTALLVLGLGVAAIPAMRLALDDRPGAALAWAGGVGGLGLLGLGLLLADPEAAAGLRTVERLQDEAGGLESRIGLWSAALDWAGRAAPFGLGTGGFAIAAGHGERRGLYPHNHALEALAEAGLPGLLLWLLAFGGALAVAARLARRVAPGRAATIAALVLPVALSVMVSTDLGNRMAWFALGLALSLGVTARPTPRAVPRHV